MDTVKDKIILFTGATSGLGKIAAIKLASQGATVIATVRDNAKSTILLKELKEQHPNAQGTIVPLECDLSSFKSIKQACNKVAQEYPRVDILVNNAGVWNFKFIETSDGIESTLQVNVLAPMLITNLLLDSLKKSDSPKVINTASALHQGTINFNDIEYRKSFNGFKAYRQSKLGIILITRLYQKKYQDLGINFYSQHPGVVNTDLARDGGWFSKQFFKIFGKSPEKGAQTLLHLTQTPSSKLKGGEYYKNSKASRTTTRKSNSIELAKELEEVCIKYL